MPAEAKSQTLLVTERYYLPALIRLLGSAEESIDVLAYSFSLGGSAGLDFKSATYKIAAKLISRKKTERSMRIRVYLEGERDTASRNRIAGRLLEKNGIEVHYGSTHAKGFRIDSKFVLFGSTNLTNQSINKNFETNLFTDEPAAVTEFGRYFDHLWEGGRHGGVKLKKPLYADGAFKKELLATIAKAKKTIHFSIYFFDQDEIAKALIAAHRRGVHVAGFLHDHRSFALSYVRRTRKTAERLAKAGIADLHLAPPTLFTHSKYLIADRSVLALGTGNWLDEDVEIHPQLYIFLRDKALAGQLAKHLLEQIKKFGTSILDRSDER